MQILILSTLLTFVITFFTIQFARGVRNPIRSFVPQTTHDKVKVSPFGGVAMFFASFVVIVIFVKEFKSLLLLLPVFAMLLLGLADDLKKVFSKSYHGVSARFKFLIQSLITVFVCFLGVFFNPDFETFRFIIPFYGVVEFKLNLILAFLISYFAFAGTVNAVNLTDGLDGLAGKQVLVLLSFILTLLYFVDFTGLKFNLADLKLILLSFIGALIGFLFFNSNPAKIFMGDAGSMGFGALLASILIMLKLELILPFVGFVIFMEALSVIMQVAYFKYTKGKRIFKMSPIHHHFQLSGVKEQKITELAFLITIMLALIFLTPFYVG